MFNESVQTLMSDWYFVVAKMYDTVSRILADVATIINILTCPTYLLKKTKVSLNIPITIGLISHLITICLYHIF